MRIFHICLCNRWGGQEMLVHTVAQSQLQQGHSVCIVAREGSPLAQRAETTNISTLAYKSGLHIFSFPFQLRCVLFKENADVVHFHHLRAVRRFLPILPKTETRPVYIYTEHSHRPVSIASWYNSYVLSLLDDILVVSETQRDITADQLNLHKDRLKVLFNGVDSKKYVPLSKAERDVARAELGVDKDVPLVVCAGRIVPPKGQDLFIEAAIRLLENSTNLLFEISGEINQVSSSQQKFISSLRNRITKANLQKKIQFRGFVHNISTYFAAADVVVVPSRVEAFGLVAAEAMACGTPVVVANAGALPEVVEYGRCGFVFEKDNIEDLAQRIKQALDVDCKMVKRGRERIENVLSLNVHVRSLQNIYKEAITRVRKR